MTGNVLSADEVLTTTRAVRRRLDLTRAVPDSVIRECLEIALQAPTGSNRQNWHFMIVTDPALKLGIGDLYREGGPVVKDEMLQLTRITPADTRRYQAQTDGVLSAAGYLFEHIHEVPGMLIPCIRGRLTNPSAAALASHLGSIMQATWSFMLAARARNIGTVWTTVHLANEQRVAELLGIPYDEVMQMALIPFGYVTGDPFKRGTREPLELVAHWNGW